VTVKLNAAAKCGTAAGPLLPHHAMHDGAPSSPASRGRTIGAILVLGLMLNVPALAQLADPTFDEAVSLFEDQDYEAARTIAQKLASAGDSRAMAMLGALYQGGHGVAADRQKAVEWFTKAAGKGHMEAAYTLAMMYVEDGDTAKARPWLEKTAAAGNMQAAYNLGILFLGLKPPDYKSAAPWFTKAANAGVAEAQYNLGRLNAEGLGVAKDRLKAGEWFAKAAVQGLPDAALDYGIMVFRGEGVKKDEKIGAQWLLIAASRGNPVAQNRVARLYATGRGVEADPVEAAKWNILAAKGGRGDTWLDDYVKKLAPNILKDAEARAAAFKPTQDKPE
jgi:uncharacterized protein